MTWVGAFLFGILLRQVIRFQLALAEVGRNMCVADNKRFKPIEYQNSITPPWLINFWMLFAGGTVVIVGYDGFLFGVSAAFVTLLFFGGGFLLSGGVSAALSRPTFEAYCRCALHTLVNREADYRRDGDIARADAAKHFVWLMAMLMGKPGEEIVRKNAR